MLSCGLLLSRLDRFEVQYWKPCDFVILSTCVPKYLFSIVNHVLKTRTRVAGRRQSKFRTSIHSEKLA